MKLFYSPRLQTAQTALTTQNRTVSAAPLQASLTLPAASDTVHFSARTPSFKSSDESRNADIDAQLSVTDTAEFQESFNQVVDRLKEYLGEQKRLGKKGFVVLDIDETTLDNRDYFRDPAQKFYKKARGRLSIRSTWVDWVKQSASPAIPATKRLIDWMNEEGVPYLFLTGIQQSLSESSVANLKYQGVWGPQCLGAYYRPDTVRQDLASFKKDKREELSDLFKLPVLATLGDRPADMTNNPEKNFLLPCYVVNLRTRND